MALLETVLALGLVFFFYLFHVNRALSTTPDEITRIAGEPYTTDSVRAAYEKYRKEKPDFTKYLPPKQNRRYVVFGGSGLVGGWMVEHLIMRGQNPKSIRIADLQTPRRERAVNHVVPFFKTDVTDPSAVAKVINDPWPSEYADLPLTVFHTVAYIHAGYRKRDFLPRFMKVNFEGTKIVMEAAKAAGCDIFIATSSASIGIKPMKIFMALWKRYPKNYAQFSENADPPPLELENFPGCYAYSKAMTEKMVLEADSKESGFRTGAIRPGHAIYGHGDETNLSSIVMSYLHRGGFTTWMTHLVLQYVSAQNVSLAHLLFEARIHTHDVAGKAYCVCDPGPPFRYSDLYLTMKTLAHPATPMQFTPVPPLPMAIMSYMMEAYIVFQHRYARSWLPPVTNFDLSTFQRAVFNYASLNVIYDDSRARRELGYNPGADTLEGVCLHLLEWNDMVEDKLRNGESMKQVQSEVQDAGVLEKAVPVPAKGVVN